MIKSDRQIQRALTRLDAPQAVLVALGSGGFGVCVGGDRRRRPLARLPAADARALIAEGVLEACGEGFVLSHAGRARLRRAAAAPQEAWLAQHAPIATRVLTDADGASRPVRSIDATATLKRLSLLRAGDGAAWLSSEEMAAAARLCDDWRAGQQGLLGASDWTAPPRGSAPRGPGNAQEARLAHACDARRRADEALASLAAPLRRVVERVCLHEHGIEALERGEGWPARSGKIALKLGLAQLAACAAYRRR